MPAYFRDAKQGDTFYGQPVDSSPAAPVIEFTVIGVTEDFITACIPATRTNVGTVHVFSRHTGISIDGWAHVKAADRRWRINHFQNKALIGLGFVLTVLLACVLIRVW